MGLRRRPSRFFFLSLIRGSRSYSLKARAIRALMLALLCAKVRAGRTIGSIGTDVCAEEEITKIRRWSCVLAKK